MKEVCGFEDSKGRFHRTKKEVEKAEAQIKIHNIENTLRSLDTKLSNLMWHSGAENLGGIDASRVKSLITENLAHYILQNSDSFIEIVNTKKSLEKELDLLSKVNSYKPWWLKIEWWK